MTAGDVLVITAELLSLRGKSESMHGEARIHGSENLSIRQAVEEGKVQPCQTRGVPAPCLLDSVCPFEGLRNGWC